MMTTSIRQGFRRGLLFAIIVIFILLIGFHSIVATVISKVFGINVLRGAIPEIRFMLITHILFGIWAGWSAVSDTDKKINSILKGAVTGFTAGIAVIGIPTSI